MLNFFFSQIPVFLGGECMLALSLGMFGAAWVGTMRERYSVKVRTFQRTAV
jgi:hypothetical protein